ncbi:toxin-antitoxin system HicB family antitoxin [Ornithinimicrobium pekingense]|uniref:Toxin-antitoxin system HicB family antitoxin n=1 Tax=Ornithinimicrobium pekingense TaxID=384677 RepID=A0ABQ2FC46_9MICO|nr:toxin-antitoxin system HicB family antitoxin [Ornithinimicrobium pekingense]GGK82292.1 hypothetical protein GCM10011509_33540 [Ornithinimicrobium pekingense]
MDLHPYLDAVAADLDRATALADDSTRDLAHRLASAIEPGLRMALVRAVSDTAAQINTQLDDAVVTVTIAGHEPLVTVTRTAALETHGGDGQHDPAAPPAGPEDRSGVDPGGTVRITLRLPEQLKTRAEELAERAEQSLNTWLVQAVRRATTDGRRARASVPGSRRHTGWA